MEVKAEKRVEEESKITPYFGGLNLIVFAAPVVAEQGLRGVIEGTMGAFGRESDEMLEFEF